ncbi:hypothetical protein E4U42_000646 [Claviceps africana]|uniref:Uncharacterized protein n=1 Tax=Claviceps africana TaxID=83212 RepID=A0A8K0NJL9_9HYPO|nr:hypothetical protein E4U42_000646 [Claviceps africana]
MSRITPQRIVLKCNEQYNQDFDIIVQHFLRSQNLPSDDYVLHHLFDYVSPYVMYLVLDVHCRAVSDVNLDELELKVFKVSKPRSCYIFRDMGERAIRKARPQSLELKWGEYRTCQSGDVRGLDLAQMVVHVPGN